MSQAAKKIYTPAEYLALEAKADYRSEYFDGEIFKVAGGNKNHNRLINNLAVVLAQAFVNRPCEYFTENVRLLVSKNGLYTYPDVMAVCGRVEVAETDSETVTNPGLLVEVLSESTMHYDRTTKFKLYQSLDSLRTYLLIDQYRHFVELYQKNEAGEWIYHSYDTLEDYIELSAVGVTLTLAQLYNRVSFSIDAQEN